MRDVIVELSMQEEAKLKYEEYMEAGLKMFPPFKGYGIKTIQFAIDEPELYRIHFMCQCDMSTSDFFNERVEIEKILPYVRDSLELNNQDARWLITNMVIYTLGIGSLLVNSTCIMSVEEISRSLGSVCRGLMMQLKAPEDERVETIPDQNIKELGRIEEYVKGKKNMIIGYNADREMFQIRLDAVLYFEAVGEKVFAYTKQHVYEIRQRLYQVEEQVKPFAFIRASKSLLVSIKKISSVIPESGGRGRLRMMNGETIIASRAYYKEIIDTLKDPVL